jgi:hypothetical protein
VECSGIQANYQIAFGVHILGNVAGIVEAIYNAPAVVAELFQFELTAK